MFAKAPQPHLPPLGMECLSRIMDVCRPGWVARGATDCNRSHGSGSEIEKKLNDEVRYFGRVRIDVCMSVAGCQSSTDEMKSSTNDAVDAAGEAIDSAAEAIDAGAEATGDAIVKMKEDVEAAVE